MFCVYCGTSIPGDCEYCPACGEKINSNSEGAHDKQKRSGNKKLFISLSCVIGTLVVLLVLFFVIILPSVKKSLMMGNNGSSIPTGDNQGVIDDSASEVTEAGDIITFGAWILGLT